MSRLSQCLAARKVYSFLIYRDFIYENTVHMSGSSESSKAVRLGFNLNAYIITQSCCK